MTRRLSYEFSCDWREWMAGASFGRNGVMFRIGPIGLELFWDDPEEYAAIKARLDAELAELDEQFRELDFAKALGYRPVCECDICEANRRERMQ